MGKDWRLCATFLYAGICSKLEVAPTFYGARVENATPSSAPPNWALLAELLLEFALTTVFGTGVLVNIPHTCFSQSIV